MRAYVRGQSSIDLEISGKLIRDLSPDPRPASWAQFSRAIEAGAQDAARRIQPTVKRLAHCGGLSVARSFDCGKEDATLDAWCGHAYCPACATSESAEVAKFVRQNWDPQLISVEISVPGDMTSPALPSPDEVATIRAAWAEATKSLAETSGLERVESVPRVLVAPQLITIFARYPGVGESQILRECLIEGLQVACDEGGLGGAEVSSVSREEAATQIRKGIFEQARRFAAGVERDLQASAWPTEVSARRWIGQIEAHHGERRRKRLLGGKGSLPVSGTSSSAGKKASCSAHGGHCHVITTRVRERDSGDLVIAYPGDQVPSAGGPVAASFFATAAKEGVRRPWISFRGAGAPEQLRRAG
jgi:hypothetical protein